MNYRVNRGRAQPADYSLIMTNFKRCATL